MKIAIMIAAFGSLCSAATPTFTFDWSEYPSWSAFGVAEELGLINKEEGKQGELELKHNIDIILRNKDYDTCITLYTSGNADATCLTNMDSLSPSLSIPSTIILPTSNSFGADMLIVDGDRIKSIEDLKNYQVKGLELSVSQYLFERGLQEQGFDPLDFKFSNMAPEAAAIALQQSDKNVAAICIWNPYAIQTLNTKNEAMVLFDSRIIPNEIIDCVVITNKALQREGGDRFAACIVEAFYAISDRLNSNDRVIRDETLIALGDRFSNLGLSDMREVVRQTRFYSTPEQALQLFNGAELEATMNKVSDFCHRQAITSRKPNMNLGNGSKNADLTFDKRFVEDFSKK